MPRSQGRYLVVLEPPLLPLLQVFSAAARGPSPRNQTPSFFILEPVQAHALRLKAPSPASPVAPWHTSVSARPPPPRPPTLGRSVLS